MPAPSPASAPHLWYVHAAGRAWGPYSEERMTAFLAEGRITAATPVSPWGAGPYAPAGEAMTGEAMTGKGTTGEAMTGRRPTPAPVREPAATRPAPDIAPPTPAAGPTRPLLVVAGLTATGAEGFQTALAGFGPWALLRPGLWLVQARTDAAGLRNALSRGLASHEFLLVVEALLDRAAWFNLGQSAERQLRQFWGG